MMKPSVINNNSSETSHPTAPPHHDQQNIDNNLPNNSANNDQSRRFPQFRVSCIVSFNLFSLPRRFFSIYVRDHPTLCMISIKT